MADGSSIADRPLTDQVVLLAAARAECDGETPLQTHELRRRCDDAAEAEVAGTITEADVMRSLYRLEDEDLVEEAEVERTSPTGKGRRAYAPGISAETVLEGVDERLLDGTRFDG